MSTSDNTLQEQTIIHDPRAMAPASRFLYNPNLNKSLRYKGFGGYLVERDPLRQWGQAQFRMVLTNRWPRSASTWLPLSKLPQRPALPPFAHPAAANGSPSRRDNGQHRGRSRVGPIAGQDKPAVTIKARSSRPSEAESDSDNRFSKFRTCGIYCPTRRKKSRPGRGAHGRHGMARGCRRRWVRREKTDQNFFYLNRP
jgi:hypothetical protein